MNIIIISKLISLVLITFLPICFSSDQKSPGLKDIKRSYSVILYIGSLIYTDIIFFSDYSD